VAALDREKDPLGKKKKENSTRKNPLTRKKNERREGVLHASTNVGDITDQARKGASNLRNSQRGLWMPGIKGD